MTKNELLHLHALFVRVAERFLEAGVLREGDLAPYEALDVSPVAVRAARSEHERAVRTLAAVLADAAGGDDAASAVREPGSESVVR